MGYQLTKQEIIKEIVKSGKDPVYFINNYAKISHPVRGLIPFKTYDFQDDLLKDFNDYRFNVILKARQLGISTICAAYVVWMMMCHRDKNVMVMATKFSTATNLVRKVKHIIKVYFIIVVYQFCLLFYLNLLLILQHLRLYFQL